MFARSFTSNLLLLGFPLIGGLAWVGSYFVAGNITQWFPFALVLLFAVPAVCFAMLRRQPWALLGTLAMSAFLLSISFVDRDRFETRSLDWQNGLKIMLWCLSLVVFAGNIRHVRRYFADPAFALFSTLFLFALLSSVYSSYPAITFATSLGVLAYIAFATLLVEFVEFKLTLRILLIATTLYLLCNLAAPFVIGDAAYMVTDPNTGALRYRGISGQPNTLAEQIVVYDVLLLLVVSRGEVNRLLALVLLTISTVALLWTNSRTPSIALVVAMILQMRGKHLFVLAVIGAVVGGVMLAAGGGEIIIENIGRNGDASDATSLAGRTELWGYALSEVMNAPILGHGFNTFQAATSNSWFSTATYGAISHTHNNLVEVLYSNGIIGLLIFVSALAVLLYRWQVRPNIGRDVMVWALIITGFTEVPFSAATVLPNLVFYIILAADVKGALYDR